AVFRQHGGGPVQSGSYQHLQQAHPLISGAEHERKRRYLSLLPPPQVIEICLTFDIHVPPFIKATVWPADLDASISALQIAAERHVSSHNVSSTAEPNPKPNQPLKPPNTATEAPGPPSASGSYQPQRFSYAAQPAYPHTPYYAQSSWSSYTQPPYSVTHPYVPPAVLPPTSLHPPHYPESTMSSTPPEDMPSYEDMIVEALNDDVRDPEGLAPKELYIWMSNHYPVQANFRPSASQALQKAYKRGRFEKSSSGKYRLNPNWKGGNTTRRTTRRPQTHASSVAAARFPSLLPPSSKSSTYSHPSSYSLSYLPATTAQPADPHPEEDLGDAYEAAQHILRALNFGGEMLKMPVDHEDEAVSTSQAARTSSHVDTNPSSADVESVRAELQVQLVVLAAQLSEIGGASDAQAIGASFSSTAPENSVGVGSLDVVAAALTMLPPGENDFQLFVGSSATPVYVHSNLDATPPTPSVAVEDNPPPGVPVSAATPELVPMDAMDDSDDEDMDEVILSDMQA
ncbi:hypothetical protein BDP27DRAFT_65893, partial [Rhodocollybia butyracea]